MPEQDLAFGIDLSRWNTSSDGKTKVDFDVIANHPQEVVFIAMRAGISWGYQDPWFNYYFQEAGRIGRVRIAYHVMYPGERADRQMDNFFRILGKADLDQTPLVLDLELDHGHSRTRITNITKECLDLMAKRSGRTPFIYSRTSWINTYLSVGWLPPVHWWLAKYKLPLPYPFYTPEHPTPPYPLPTAVYEWTIQQTANRGAQIGAPANYFMDYNRWNGTKQELYKTLGLPIENSPSQHLICPVDGQPCPKLKRVPPAKSLFQGSAVCRGHETPAIDQKPCTGGKYKLKRFPTTKSLFQGSAVCQGQETPAGTKAKRSGMSYQIRSF